MADLASEVLVREVLVIDDDEVSRELLMLFVAEAGYAGLSAASGDEALALLQEHGCTAHAVLADMQMDGTTGNALAKELRAACGPGTRLIAMSGSGVKAGAATEFDEFLLKPVTMEELKAAIEGGEHGEGTSVAEEDAALNEPVFLLETIPLNEAIYLNETIYASLAKSMPLGQLMKLYGMCLDDAERRIGTMRAAVAASDGAEYERAAHAIKGGCGMVGATELAKLAGEMERNGMKAGGEVEPLEQFLVASVRLRRILDARVV